MKINSTFFALVFSFLMAGCSSYKNVPYLQNPEIVNSISEQLPLYDARIMPKDLLTITVNTTDPQAAAPFNLSYQVQTTKLADNVLTTGQSALQQYLVNNEGEITMPVIGKVKVVGMTKNQAEEIIRVRLEPYLKEEPIVTVRMANYKISVLGEVAKPGSFTINNEKVNVLEALAMAGDLTIYGLRDNVKLIREDAQGKREIITLNLNNAELVTCPYFYLKQNDILYVTPNETKAKNSDIGNSTTLWFSATSILVSIASLLATILK